MSLKSKASKIDFASMVNAHAQVPDARQPKTAPGAMMAFANDQRSDLLRENEELRQRAERAGELESKLGEALEDLRGWEEAKPTRLLDPAQVLRSRYANRHDSSFLNDDFTRLKREIQEAGGNVQPIKVRALPAVDGTPRYEIVFGHRRHQACLELGLPVLAMVDNLDDRSLFVEMERENRERQDLSPWEQGVMYARALETGLFSSNRQLAAQLGLDHSNIGKSLALARLPEEVVAAFSSPLEIQLRWAPLLNQALEVDPDGLKRRAQEMATGRGNRSSKAVLAYLVNQLTAEDLGASKHFETDGRRVATVVYDAVGRGSVRFNVALSAERRSELERFVDDFVQRLN